MNIKDFKWTEKRFGTRFANILKKLGGLSKDGTDGSIEYKDEQGNVTKLVTDSNFSSLLAKNGLIEVKWQELKDKRDNGQLIPGSLYRITDYNCTTTQENTRSAGHQFDIVLLALSEDKLAEEGWAMEHPTDVYDVTFADGVTKKCYVYKEGKVRYIIFDITNTLKGYAGELGTDYISVDEVNKVLICDVDNGPNSDGINELNLTYNYFQNSNLSAWKVWYCLDNDKSRFAWADKGNVIPGKLISVTFNKILPITGTPTSTIIHKSDGDYIQLTGTGPGATYYYKQGTTVGDSGVYIGNGNPSDPTMGSPYVITAINTTEPTIIPEGKGVIYRLIDEFNNDVAYDFKNIQFVRKLTDGELDTSTGTDTWVYTFNGWDGDNSACVDATTDITLGFNDIHNNIQFTSSLGDNVFLGECYDIKIMDTNCGLITLSNCMSTILIATYKFELADENGAIYIANKKVLTEE